MHDASDPKVIVVMPAFNAARTLRITYEELPSEHYDGVILVDDVLHSGRTVKAALDELFDHGRPACVELAVLVDRGGRLLPVAATYTGITLVAGDTEKVKVRLDAKDPSRDTLKLEPGIVRAARAAAARKS